nr:ELWxxDGT repeat protein [Haliscomenobacter sp.]
MYFSADNGINGHELWRTDGTEEGTVLLFDLNKGSASSDPDHFTSYQNDLYFAANDGVQGSELWRLLSDNVVSTAETGIAEILIFPNPATDRLTIRKTEENKNLQIRLHDANGRTVINSTLLRDASTDFNVSHLSAGLYLLEIVEEGTAKKYAKKIVIVR